MREVCEKCKYCLEGRESLCTGCDFQWTYSLHWRGYATQLQQPASDYFKLPENLILQKASPILCARITVYTPMKKYLKGKKDLNCAVIGIGGLGHLAVQFLNILGHKVTAITSTLHKKESIIAPKLLTQMMKKT